MLNSLCVSSNIYQCDFRSAKQQVKLDFDWLDTDKYTWDWGENELQAPVDTLYHHHHCLFVRVVQMAFKWTEQCERL